MISVSMALVYSMMSPDTRYLASAMVARRAGVSTATLYKHFRTKADLFGAVMASAWSDDVPAGDGPLKPGDPWAGPTRLGQDYVRLLQQPFMVPLFRVIIAEGEHFPELARELYERGKKPSLDRVAAYLDGEVRARTLKIVNVPLATRQFAGMINDVVFCPRFLIKDLDVSAAQAKQVVKGAVDTFLARYGTADGK
jgi:AcrR family transcriptional regulator